MFWFTGRIGLVLALLSLCIVGCGGSDAQQNPGSGGGAGGQTGSDVEFRYFDEGPPIVDAANDSGQATDGTLDDGGIIGDADSGHAGGQGGTGGMSGQAGQGSMPSNEDRQDVIHGGELCETAASIELGIFARGVVSEDETEWFCFAAGPHSEVDLSVRSLGPTFESAQVAVHLNCEEPALETFTGLDIESRVELERNETYCLNISGNGAYRLSLYGIRDLISADTVEPTDGRAGDLVRITGTGFGDAREQVLVYFGQALASIEDVSNDAIDVRVPVYGRSGDVVVNVGGQIAHLGPFAYRQTTERPGFSWSPPNESFELNDAPGVYGNRAYVGFYGHLGAEAVDEVLASIVAEHPRLDAYDIVGIVPTLNTYQVEWSWTGDGPDADAYRGLLNTIADHPSVDTVDPEVDVVVHDLPPLGFPTDVTTLGDCCYRASEEGIKPRDADGEHSSRNAPYRQLSAEEAWRFYRYWSWESAPPRTAVAVLDTGLETIQYCRTPDSGGAPLCWAELPADRNRQYRYVQSVLDPFGFLGEWEELASAQDDFSRHPAGTNQGSSHGTRVTGIIHGVNHRADRRTHTSSGELNGTNGILTGFDRFGVDDDHDGNVDNEDEDGESPLTEVILFEVFKREAADGGWPLIWKALHALGTSETFEHVRVVNMSIGAQNAFFGEDRRSQAHKAFKAVPSHMLTVVAAGNEGEALIEQGFEALAYRARPTSTLVVSGTSAWFADRRARDSNFGWPSQIAAPYHWWSGLETTLDEEGNLTGSYTPRNAGGTSFSTPAVSAAASLISVVQPELPPGTVKRILLDSATNISSTWNGNDGDRMHRLDLANAVLRILKPTPTVLSVYVLGRRLQGGTSEPVLWRTAVDAQGRRIEGADRHSQALRPHGCLVAEGLAVDALGDVVYVVCRQEEGELWVRSYHAMSLEPIGDVRLDGNFPDDADVGDPVALVNGFIYVPVAYGNQIKVHGVDGFGGLELVEPLSIETPHAEHIRSSKMGPRGQWFIATSGANQASDDNDALFVLSLPWLGGLPYLIDPPDIVDFSDTEGTFQLRDADWQPDGHLLGVWGVSDSLTPVRKFDMVEIDADFSSQTVRQIDRTDNQVSIAIDPTGRSHMAYIGSRIANAGQAGQQPGGLRMVNYTGPFRDDLHLSPVSRYTFSFGNAGGDSVPVSLEFAENGGFVSGVWHLTTAQGTRSMVLNLPHDPERQGEFEGLDHGLFSSAMHQGFLDADAQVAVGPITSVVSPRPGSYVDGYRRLLVVVRDPAIAELTVLFKGVGGDDIPEATCAFVPVVKGVSRDCVIDPSKFPEDTFRVLAEIVGTDTVGQIRSRKWVWYEIPSYN